MINIESRAQAGVKNVQGVCFRECVSGSMVQGIEKIKLKAFFYSFYPATM
jgi:hypothetical protein